jgi:hypothetical protein
LDVLDQVPDVDVAVGVGQGGGDEQTAGHKRMWKAEWGMGNGCWQEIKLGERALYWLLAWAGRFDGGRYARRRHAKCKRDERQTSRGR